MFIKNYYTHHDITLVWGRSEIGNYGVPVIVELKREQISAGDKIKSHQCRGLQPQYFWRYIPRSRDMRVASR